LRPSGAWVLPIAALSFSLQAATAPVAPGVPNFHQVNEHLYRGGQPTEQGFQSLAKMGVKTVIDVRESGSRSTVEEKLVTNLGMKYVSIPISGCPRPEHVTKVLGIFHDDSAGPVFLHCRRGADRTGTLVACYRIEHDRWD